jgi:hypothetical protein
MSEGECIGQFMAHIIFRCFLLAVVRAIDKYIVPRRDSIIRRGRQLQDLLRLPECICIFAKTDPGMPDRDIRFSAEVLSLCGLLSFLTGLLVLDGVAIGDSLVLVMGVAVPGSMVCLLWLGLALSKRHRLRRQISGTEEGRHATGNLLKKEQADQQADDGGSDPSPRASLRAIWADTWLIPIV